MTARHARPPAHASAATRGARQLSTLLHTRTALLACIGLLFVASLVLIGSQVSLVKQRVLAIKTQTAWQAASRIELAKTNETRRREAIDMLMKEAGKTDLVASAWDERRFGIRQSSMTRKAANRLLGEVARSRGRIFSAEQFEMSVKEPQDGLFTPPALPDTELLVSLRGSLLYRAKAASK